MATPSIGGEGGLGNSGGKFFILYSGEDYEKNNIYKKCRYYDGNGNHS